MFSVVWRCPAHPAGPAECSVSQHLSAGNVTVGQIGAGNSPWGLLHYPKLDPQKSDQKPESCQRILYCLSVWFCS